MNLKAFGFDQNYVQRYHTAQSARDASRSIWLCVKIYVPVSLLFFVIGTSLYAYYNQFPELLEPLRLKIAAAQLPAGSSELQILEAAARLTPQDIGDKAMPHFIVTRLPAGLIGLIIAAILSAAMSTISSGMNASATVFVEDIYKRYINKDISDRQQLRLLYLVTALVGLLAIMCGIAMIGVKSILDLWWELSGIFAGGMLGLFLLGLISKKANSSQALIATITGLLVIIWMTFSPMLPDKYAYFKNILHANMITVVGTLTIFLTGVVLAGAKRARLGKH
jgi:SSS family solute:Na+ symporter